MLEEMFTAFVNAQLFNIQPIVQQTLSLKIPDNIIIV
jgi:hypothetical protein